jgi:hypothetical protein
VLVHGEGGEAPDAGVNPVVTKDGFQGPMRVEKCGREKRDDWRPAFADFDNCP